MAVALVTGSCGLVGSSCVALLHERGFDVVGVDNGLRARFFGAEAETLTRSRELERRLPRYTHYDTDVRDSEALAALVRRLSVGLSVVVHAAAQPSHDWSAEAPAEDFSINAQGTLSVLEAVRQYAPKAVVVVMSTNKVYGDRPNRLPLRELSTRWDLDKDHACYSKGLDESVGLDQSVHSLFGVSKAAGDLLAQEYGRNLGIVTTVLRPGCITGANHTPAEQHGFLAYLAACLRQGRKYTIYGYHGKQVRDVLHADDLAGAVLRIALAPPNPGEVFNLGGGRANSCSIIEATQLIEKLADRRLQVTYSPTARTGDHIWWISDIGKFQKAYPDWSPRRSLSEIALELVALSSD